MDARSARDLTGSCTFLDVREPYEWDAGHIADALHVPIEQIVRRFEELPGDRPIVVVCHVGQRSALVAEFLRERGYDAHNLEGGLMEWHAHGFPLVSGPAAASTSQAGDV